MIIKLPIDKTLKRLGFNSCDIIQENIDQSVSEGLNMTDYETQAGQKAYDEAQEDAWREVENEIRSKLMHILNYDTMVTKGQDIFELVKLDSEHITIRVLNPNLALDQIVHAINGVGMFHYSSVKEYMHVNSTTSKKKAIEASIDWLFRLPEIYGR